MQTRGLGLVDDDQSDGECHLAERRRWTSQHIYTARKTNIPEIQPVEWFPIAGTKDFI